MICADAIYFVMSSYFKDLVENVINSFANFLIRDDVNIVEDAHRFLELGDLDRIFVKRIIQPEALRLDFIQGLITGQAGEKIDGSILIFLFILF